MPKSVGVPVVLILFCLFVPSTSRIQLPLKVSKLASADSSYGLEVTEDGTIFFATYFACAVHKLPPSGGTAQVVAGSYGTCGSANGVGSSARFFSPAGMSRDVANNVMYIADLQNNRIRVMNLATYSVTTLFGSTAGSTNGPFSTARLYFCSDVIFHSTSSGSRVLYIADWHIGFIRKADLITSTVSTLATYPGVMNFVLSKNGSLLFIASTVCTVLSVDTTTGGVTVLAGVNGQCSFLNGVGTAARVAQVEGVALNHDETLLFIGDRYNYRLRQLVLSNLSVTTLAGTGAASSVNGPLLSSTFVGPTQTKWYCDRLTSICGVMVADCTPGSSGGIRWIPITPASISMSISPRTNENTKTLSIVASPTMSSPATSSPTTTKHFSSTFTVVHTYSLSDTQDNTATASHVRSASKTLLVSPDLTLSRSFSMRSQTAQLSNSFTASCSSSRSVTASVVRWTSKTLLVSPDLTLSRSLSLHSQTAHPSASSTASCSTNRSVTASVVRWTTHTIVESNEATLSRSSTKRSATPNASTSSSHSSSASLMRWTTHTVVLSNEATLTRSMSLATWTGDATVTVSRWPSESAALSLSRAVSNTHHSASPTPTTHRSWTALVEGTSTMNPSASLTPTPTKSSTSDVTATQSPPTRTKSSTMFDCNPHAPQSTGVMLVGVNSSTQLHNTSAPLALIGSNAANASYASRNDEGVSPLVFLSSQGIDRVALLQAPPLAFNLTLASPFQLLYYYVGNVTTLHGTSTSATWSARPRSGVWHGVVVQPPSIGWVGDVVFPVLLYREMNLLVPLLCGDGRPMLTVVLTVPSPGVPRDLAAEVRRATQVTLIASLLATGAVSGSALGRILATDSMVLCDADAAGGGGVLDFSLELCAASPDLVVARSAIVSNAVLVAAAGLFLALLAALWFVAVSSTGRSAAPRAPKMSFLGAATGVFSMPSSMLPLLTSTIPSTAVSTTLLAARVASSSCIALDVFLILLGILLCAVPVFLLSRLAMNAVDRWACSAVPDDNAQTTLASSLHRVMRRSWKWRVVNADHHESLWAAWVVLLEYRVLWYASADTLFLVAVSSLAVVGGLDVTNEALCRGCSAAVVVLLGAQVAVLCVWRPYTTLFSLVYNVLTTALTCVSVAAQLAFVVTSFTSTSGLWLVDASAVCNLLVLGLSLVKMVLDAWELWNAVRRRVASALCGVADDKEAADCFRPSEGPLSLVGVDVDDELLSLSLSSLVTTSVERPSALSSSRDKPLLPTKQYMLDYMFWDESGQAVGTSHAEELNEILTTVVR